MNIREILEELRKLREKASNVISALEAEDDSRLTRKFLDSYLEKRQKIDAAVIAMDNLTSGKRRGRRPGWIQQIRSENE